MHLYHIIALIIMLTTNTSISITTINTAITTNTPHPRLRTSRSSSHGALEGRIAYLPNAYAKVSLKAQQRS